MNNYGAPFGMTGDDAALLGNGAYFSRAQRPMMGQQQQQQSVLFSQPQPTQQQFTFTVPPSDPTVYAEDTSGMLTHPDFFELMDTEDDQQQAFNASQNPTPPQEFSSPTFSNPFQQNQPITNGQPQQQNGFQGQQQPQNLIQGQQQPPQQGPVYSFNRGYQNAEPGYFGPQQARGSSGSANGSTPGTPGGGRVPIPRAGTSIAANGPMSANVTIPPRPKPGRKPIESENQQDRRRTQNRLAQRQFRDRRQQKLAEMTTELENQRAEAQQAQANWNTERAALMRRIQELEVEVRTLRAEVRTVRAENASFREQLEQTQPTSFYDNTGARRNLSGFRRDTTAEAAMASVSLPQTSTRPRTAVASSPAATGVSPTAAAPTPAAVPTAQAPAPNAHAHTSSNNSNEIDFTNHRTQGSFRPSNAGATSNTAISPTTTTSTAPAPAPATTSQTPQTGTENPTPNVPLLVPINTDTSAMGVEGKDYDCGFCTDCSNCQCRYNDTFTANALLDLKTRKRKHDDDNGETEDDGEGEGTPSASSDGTVE